MDAHLIADFLPADVAYANTCPLSQKQLLDEYFMDYRAQVLSLAAFLDRFDRSVERNAEDDFRIVAFREALKLLLSGGPERARQAQLLMSDRNTQLLDVRDSQGAYGASVRGASVRTSEEQAGAEQ
jgi:hypothetical protein